MKFKEQAPAALVLSALFAIGACGSDDPAGPDTPDPSIETTALAAGTVGERYAESVAATGGGGEYEWDLVDGTLPPGLGLSVEDPGGDDVIISGIPETAGSYTFDLQVQVPDGRADTATLTIEIFSEPLAIETLALVPALAGYEYSVQLEASGVDAAQASWSIVSGSLPEGLSLSSSGKFSGSPAGTDSVEIVVEASTGEASAQETFTLVVRAENTSRFDITILPAVPIPAQLRDNVAEAVRRWEAAIVGDLARFDAPEGELDIRDPNRPDNICRGFTHLADGTSIDDMIVIVNIGPIDEGGSFKPTEDGDSVFTNTIGSAGPCFIRDPNQNQQLEVGELPIVGVLTLDEFDLFSLEEDSQELATDLVQHEIGHILGLGALWSTFGLIEGAGTNDPRYTGEQGVAAYKEAGGADDSIPVENTGPAGTRDGHWRESVFDDELMTGGLKRTSFLSAMSIASFGDFGYEVDLAAAEGDLNLGTILGFGRTAPELWLHGDIGTHPIIGIGPDGTRTYVIPPSNQQR